MLSLPCLSPFCLQPFHLLSFSPSIRVIIITASSSLLYFFLHSHYLMFAFPSLSSFYLQPFHPLYFSFHSCYDHHSLVFFALLCFFLNSHFAMFSLPSLAVFHIHPFHPPPFSSFLLRVIISTHSSSFPIPSFAPHSALPQFCYILLCLFPFITFDISSFNSSLSP